MHATDAKALRGVCQLEGEKIWLVSEWLLQMPPIENWEEISRRCAHDEETWTLTVKG